MGDQPPPTPMNIDLNLRPADQESLSNIVNLDAWLEEPIRRITRAITQRSAFRQMPSLWREPEWGPQPLPPIARPVDLDLNNANGFETGEGSEIPNDQAKACDNNSELLDDSSSIGKKETTVNGNGSEWNFFNCNICLDLAKDPVVTCCGHLFCWPCIYRWLNVHSDAKECPVCKGEVHVKNLTPIYSGGSENQTAAIDSSSNLKIPPRPKARRVESWRQTFRRSRRSIAVDEIDEFLLQVGAAAEFGPTHSASASDGSGTVRYNLGEDGITMMYNNLMAQINQEMPTWVDDRDSVSSIAGIMQSDSQMDTAAEIDSRVSHSTLSSRIRNDARASDVDTAESGLARRRTFHQ